MTKEERSATIASHNLMGEKTISFSRIPSAVPIPNLLDLQRESYSRFLQMKNLPEERKLFGLEEALRSVFHIDDFRGGCSLHFVDYSLGDWECRCGRLKGLENLRQTCPHCHSRIAIENPLMRTVQCLSCGEISDINLKKCSYCDTIAGLKMENLTAECQERGLTYGIPFRIRLRLEVYEKGSTEGNKNISDIKEEEIYFGRIPMMTEKGTFIINGIERVVVSQLHRSPGVFFQANEARTEFVGKIIPSRGSWVEFEYDIKNILYVRIDRKRRFYATIFLKSLGLSTKTDLIRRFYPISKLTIKKKNVYITISENLIGLKAAQSSVDPKSKHPIFEKGKKITRLQIQKAKDCNLKEVLLDLESVKGCLSVSDIADPDTGEVLLESLNELNPDVFARLEEKGITSIEVFFPEESDIGTSLVETLLKDSTTDQRSAYMDFFKKVRPGDPVTPEGSKNFFENLFFNPKYYDFSSVGRLKFNTKFKTDIPISERILSVDDYITIVEYLLKLRKGLGSPDDIDHLGNRRVRSVGELLGNQIRIGLSRMERACKEKMGVFPDLDKAMPRDLINPKPVMASIYEFFGSSQLSQFMDQTNPLSEITHKRRLSALGPGGLSRERAGFEVRDVHTSHYGRLCPIETPEGPNIGLISSLASYAKINEFGFIETPYRKVINGRVLNYYHLIYQGDSSFKVGEVVDEDHLMREVRKITKEGKTLPIYEPYAFYLPAWEEDLHIIAQANIPFDEKGNILTERVQARKAGDFVLAKKEDVEYVDVSPKQLVSIAASLIPFLEHDDANRALMGSNMQRQSVPLLRPASPIIQTGMEPVVGKDSESTVVCKRPGIVDIVDADRIILRVVGEKEGEEGFDFGADIYPLTKFQRSNQSTCINQKPIVKVGQRVEKGQVIADGPCTDGGELALGRNVLVAFMPWHGYNYEDAILISEKLVREDVYTSIHIEELSIEARDTKLGKEEITRDIPNVNETFLSNLDESGVIRIGAHIKPGDILVGKVTPKGETQMTPEEKLLRAIFGEKSADYRDASLRCPPGISGIVVDVKIFTRKGEEKDLRALSIESDYRSKMNKNLRDEIRIIHEENKKKIIEILNDCVTAESLKNEYGVEILGKGARLTKIMLSHIKVDDLPKIKIQAKFKDRIHKVETIEARTKQKIELLEQEFEAKMARLEEGSDLLPGVIKMVKVFIAIKRKIQVGDKLAGRHGNKGVVSRILPEEDMPFLPDGTPVEIVLNPLGVPSRMNVGQILETHLGWAATALGLKIITPVFDGAREEDIRNYLKKANLPENGKITLRDGRTGEFMEQKVTVGMIYIMKLAHLVEDKIHARSIGPYSLITQQPLGGKAQFGGQRFGEMEVWALEAYGAANILQEILTVKSDDVYGRTKMYESIVRGHYPEEPGLPESFNVLVKELQGLSLDVKLIEEEPQ